MIREQTQKLSSGVYTDNLNMFRDAQNAEEIDVYLDGTVNLLGDLRGLTTLKVENTAIVKAVTIRSAIDNIHLIDLKLNV